MAVASLLREIMGPVSSPDARASGMPLVTHFSLTHLNRPVAVFWDVMYPLSILETDKQTVTFLSLLHLRRSFLDWEISGGSGSMTMGWWRKGKGWLGICVEVIDE